jgi:IS5 family transposase
MTAKSISYQTTTLKKESKMRKKTIAQRAIFDQSIEKLICLIQPEKVLKKMDRVLNQNHRIVDIVHEDLTQDACLTGAHGISAEQILRTAVLRHLKRYSWRELSRRLNDGICMRWFTRFYSAAIPHYTTLQKAVQSISDEAWNHINALLVEFARDRKIEKGRSARIDTTVVEGNILYPTDARLLWAGVRVITRIMNRVRQNEPELEFGFANRTRKSKSLCYQITMIKGPKADKIRRKLYRRLIQAANEVFGMGVRCLHQMPADDIEYDQLDYYLTAMSVAIDQCERRILKGEDVPADEKIVSIFEQHTDIVCRGKSQSPTEFGHKVFFATGRSGLVTQYEVLRGNPGDNELLPDFLARHKQLYHMAPKNLSGDRRFFSDDNEKVAASAGVTRVSICKPGYRSNARRQYEKERWFKKLQRFRAGIEGIISGLMRGFGLKRCIWKGWESFRKYVSIGVFAFNLRKIALLLQ